MRLLLDEHISPRVAEQLRAAGHDVLAAVEAGLRQRPDEELLRWAVEGRRGVVTRNVRDFRPLHARLMSRGEAHYGVIFLPRSQLLAEEGIGDVVRALHRLLIASTADETLLSQERWLTPEELSE